MRAWWLCAFLIGCGGDDDSSADASGGSGGNGGKGGSASGGVAGAGGSAGTGAGGASGGGAGASGGSGGGAGSACEGTGGSPPKPSGAVYYVATTGSDSVSCDEAKNPSTPKRNIMGASGGLSCFKTPGETLLIRAGSYDERLENYSGTPWPSGTSWTDSFTVAAYPGETVTIQGIAIATDATLSLSYWIFDGLHAISTIASEAIWTRDPDHIRFINMKASTAKRKDQCIQGGGRFMEYIDIEVYDCGDPTIAPCGGACDASYGFYWTGDDSLFERIKLHDTTGYGFHMFNTACDNVTENCPDRNVVRYSEIHDTGTKQSSSAILFAYGEGNQAYGNVIYDNSGGIEVAYGASNTKVFNNVIFGNEKNGVDIGVFGSKATSGTVVKNNVIAKSAAYAISVSAQGSIDEPSGTVLQNNLFFDNVAGTMLDTGVGTQASNNPSGDPLFVDAAAKDFKLLPGSPGVDAGLALGVPWNVAKDGACRPQGVSYDIGAFER